MHQNRLVINKIINATSTLREWVKQVTTRLQAEEDSLVTYNLIQKNSHYSHRMSQSMTNIIIDP